MGRSAHWALRLLNALSRRSTAAARVERCNFLNTVATDLAAHRCLVAHRRRESRARPPEKGVESTKRKIVLAAYRHSSSPG